MTRREWLATHKYPVHGAVLFVGGCIMSSFWPSLGIPLMLTGWFWTMAVWIRSCFIPTPRFAKVTCPACGRPEELTLDTVTWICMRCGVRSPFDAVMRAAKALGKSSEPPNPTPPSAPAS